MSRYCRGCGQSDCVCGIGLWVNSCETIPCPTCPDLKPGLKAPEDCPDCEGAGVIEKWTPSISDLEWLKTNLLTQAKRAGLPVEQLRAADLAEHLADRVAELEAEKASLQARFDDLLSAAQEVAEVARLRGEGHLNPEDDPVLWTSRWNEALANIAEEVDNG